MKLVSYWQKCQFKTKKIDFSKWSKCILIFENKVASLSTILHGVVHVLTILLYAFETKNKYFNLCRSVMSNVW